MIVELPAEVEHKLRQLAQQRGVDPAQMVREWIERELADWVVDISRPLTNPQRPRSARSPQLPRGGRSS
jgi:hypothetical protein